MNWFKSHFKFSKQERSGIFFFLFILIAIQVYIFTKENMSLANDSRSFEVDVLLQHKIDSIKLLSKKVDSFRIYPFNPNYISDFRGYQLGLSTDQIDRLHSFRAQNKFVSSEKQFQEVTGISDSLLAGLTPYFKFPSWAQNTVKEASEKTSSAKTNKEIRLLDLNQATVQDLQSIYGIGAKLSERVIKFRDRLGGFLVDRQLYDVYGLEPEVVARTLKKFTVKNAPKITRININTATSRELSKLIYINSELALRIIHYRDQNGEFSSIEELAKIQGFPSEKIHNIKLYLTL